MSPSQIQAHHAVRAGQQHLGAVIELPLKARFAQHLDCNAKCAQTITTCNKGFGINDVGRLRHQLTRQAYAFYNG